LFDSKINKIAINTNYVVICGNLYIIAVFKYKFVRQTGMIAAFTLDFSQNLGKAFTQLCLDRGVMIRPIGNHVYLIPPYCTTPAEIGHIFGILNHCLQKLCDNLPKIPKGSSQAIDLP
jgi:adenosylmethionine-8-amino-7-oxononanoate aminotransferase